MRTHESITAGGANGKVIVPHEPDEEPAVSLRDARSTTSKMPPPPTEDSETPISRRSAHWIEAGGSLAGRRGGRGRREERRRAAEGRRAADQARGARVLGVQAGGARAPCRRRRRRAGTRIRSTRSSRRRWKPKALKPSPLADRRTLIRRVYLDVLGLPPTPEAGRGVRRRHVAGGVDEGRRRGARVAALRRALGAALDGSRPLRGLRRASSSTSIARRCIAIATT